MSTELEATQEQTNLVDVQPEAETAQVEVTEQEAAPVEDDDAAFMAGFNQATGIEAPPEPQPKVKEEEPEPTPEPEPQPEPKQIAGYTEDQIKDLLAKAAEVDRLRETTSKLSGTLGAMRQSIDALKNRPAQQVSLSKEQFSRLRQVFPEMADALVEDLNGALTGGVPGQAFDASEIEQKVNGRLEQTSRAFETKLLTMQHPDWQKVVGAQEFEQWKGTLDEQTRTELDNTWDAAFIGSKLTEYKDWKSKTAQSQQQQQVKRKRLEAAITPKSSAAPAALSEDEAFLQGFKEARGIR